ncbi:MAG: UDP-glucose 4-epimerase GalE [Enterobacteriaceae bacterium]
MHILVTGGCGYIGSHTCVTLTEAGYTPIIIDNLVNSKASVLQRIETLTGQSPLFYQTDVRDRDALRHLFARYPVAGVIHFAGLKAVGESIAQPLAYYDNNVYGSLVLVEAMREAGVHNLIFSSSATVYGDQPPPYLESLPCGTPTSPYGRSKLMVEQCLQDLAVAEPQWSISLLRYFNPVGAHPSGLMGEDPQGIPNNLTPYIAQVAVGKRESLAIFGNDYPTPDGTGIRDYIHVMDLAEGHLAALQKKQDQPGAHIYNLGSGHGYSVLQMVKAFSDACGHPIPYHFAPRRPGDLPANWADANKAARELNWKVKRSLQQMAEDTWRWQSANPQGYPQ